MSRSPSIVPRLPTPPTAPLSDDPFFTAFPELECLYGTLPDDALAEAARRSKRLGVDADRVLIADGVIDEDVYVETLTRWLNVKFEPLDHRLRRECPLDDSRLVDTVRSGLLPIQSGGHHLFVVAPMLAGSRRLARMRQAGPDFTARVRLTTQERLQRFINNRAATHIGRHAAYALPVATPHLSAAHISVRMGRVIGLLIALAVAYWLTPRFIAPLVEVALGTIFVAWTGLRILSVLSTPLPEQPGGVTPDRDLPIYTIIVALHREAAAAASLVEALSKIDYPREKLDVKFVLEPDDTETIAAFRDLRLRTPFEIVIAPAAGPRTKPKALNAALMFSRGQYVAVYDAEDRPEPDQLRLALDGFARGDDSLACVQARLTIDNTADSWLTRLFTAEYAGLFDVMLPGLSSWRLPLPLGGSSNHFRTDVLRKVGAWDAFNVTEDADLGMRLARCGYTTAIINSTTYEEAPARFRPWLYQRTRWFKGWMQTWLVHMRSPRRLWREFGPASFISFQLIVGGTVLASLVHSVFIAILLAEIALGRIASIPELHIISLMCGYLVSGALGLIGLAQRRLLSTSWVLLLIPVYWVLLSIAAWRALLKLIFDPFTWEKTEHGLAKTSRLASEAHKRPPQ